MKRFGNYQYVPGFPMSDRDKKEVGSKFWNEGKWENFVLPFIESPHEKTLVDVGCNAGIFLKLAKDIGFDKAIGIEASKEAISRGLAYRDSLKMDYEIRYLRMEKGLSTIPVSDYMVMANIHYYFLIPEWLEYFDQLRAKTAHVIFVTADKRTVPCKASAKPEEIQTYFKDWEQVGDVIDIPPRPDPFPRQLYGLCFRNPDMERVVIKDMDCGNHVQDGFYKELDEGKHYRHTRYYRIMKPYRLKKHGWSKQRLHRFFRERIALWESVKKEGLLMPIVINRENRVVDGNHRIRMMTELGYKTVLARRVP